MASSNGDSWHLVLPSSIETATPGEATIPVHVPHGTTVRVHAIDESGVQTVLAQVEDNTPPREIDGVLTGRARFSLANLTAGHYTLQARLQDGSTVTGEVLVKEEVPAAGTEALGRREYSGRNWGMSAVLYAMRSTQSWGMGDLADLADLAVTVARHGGDYLTLRPILRNAAAQAARLGFETDLVGGLVIDPAYVRPEDIREAVYLPSAQRTMLDWSSESVRITNTESDPIDFDEAWDAKKAALEVIHSASRSARRQASFERFTAATEQALQPYLYAEVAQEAGGGQELYEDLAADSSVGGAARREHADRITFFLWLQWAAREQLARAQGAAREAGMRIGLIHALEPEATTELIDDLDGLAGGVFLETADPERREELARAAKEAGLVVFSDGRDPKTRDDLMRVGIAPHTTLRAEFAGEEPAGLEGLPADSMISVARIDDPPTAGALSDEHLSLMRRLGILDSDYEEVRKSERIMRERILARALEAGLMVEDATERQNVEALHQLLATSPAQFITATFSDAVGNRRPLVLGESYPDWCYPYTDGAGASVVVDDVGVNPRMVSLLDAIDSHLRTL